MTLKDVAKVAGVSVSTVSKALRDSQDINYETKNYIKNIAKGLGHDLQEKQKKPKRESKLTIGVICPETKSNYYSELLDSINENFQKKGHTVFVGFSNFDIREEIFLFNTFIEKSLDGIICITEGAEIQKKIVEINKKNNIPLVVIANQSVTQEVDYIEINDSLGVTLAINHLIEMGHSNITYIGDNFSEERKNTFIRCMKENGLTVNDENIKVRDERFEECGYLAMKELLSLKQLPTAIFAAYDDIAIGAMRAVYESNMKIPEDISFIGIDNIISSPYLYKGLTTVASPIKEMGKIACGMLLEKLGSFDNKVFQHVTLNPYIIARESVKRINS